MYEKLSESFWSTLTGNRRWFGWKQEAAVAKQENKQIFYSSKKDAKCKNAMKEPGQIFVPLYVPNKIIIYYNYAKQQ